MNINIYVDMEGGKIPIDSLGKKINLQIFKESDFLGDSLH